MKEFKCKSCHKLLFRYEPVSNLDYCKININVEVKCPKCKTINVTQKIDNILEEQIAH